MPQPSPAPRATLVEVARLAGVSIATASKALNGRQVREATRARVVEAAAELSFSPNLLARGLIAGRSGTVGLITSDLDGRFSLPVLMGAEDAFGGDHISVLLCDARGDVEREHRHVEALLSRRVDGLILVGSSTDPRPPLEMSLPIPVVYAYAPSTRSSDASVISDNVGGGAAAIDHLISVGCRNIAHVSGKVSYQAARDRAEGAAAAMRAAGLEMVGGHVLFGTWDEAWGRHAVAELTAQHPGLDGLFCGSDQIARGALEALRELGRRVPEDVAVVGFDNWEAMSVHARPPLTSVDMNLEKIGTVAAHTLFDAIENPTRTPSSTLPCRLIHRQST